MKLRKVSAAALVLAIALAGCGPAENQPPVTEPSPTIYETPTPPPAQTPEVTPEPTPSEPVPSESAPVPEPTPSEPAKPSPEPSEEPVEVPAVDTYYALVVDDVTCTVDQPFVAEGLFGPDQYIENPAEFPFPASRFYENDGMTAQTFLAEDGSEKLISLSTWKKGSTSAGIQIGSTLEELKAAYPTMQLLDGVYSDGYGDGIKYSRMYVAYRPDDGTNCFYQFYLNEREVVMIEVLDGLDAPRTWYDFESPLGMENLHWECISSGGEVTYRYFDVLEDGTEAYVLDIVGTVEHHDLDGDGKLEILNHLWDGDTKNLEIYGATETGLTIINVNETLGCGWSSFMGNIGNLYDSAYRTCIQVGIEPGGSSDVYSYQNGQLTFECTFEEAMGWTAEQLEAE